MIRPRRDLIIALTLLCISIPAFFYGLPGILRDESSPAVGVAVIAGLVGFFAGLMALNFLYALRIMQRLERGEGVVARWSVSSETMAAFRKLEKQGARNHWRPRNNSPVEIIVGQETVLAGASFYSVPTSGMQRVQAVRIVRSEPMAIEFDTQTLSAEGGPSSRRLVFVRGSLRIPVTDRHLASTVLQHFQEVLVGRKIIAPKRWAYRVRGGIVGLVVAAVAGLTGYVLAVANNWRVDVPLGWVPLVLLITAPLLAIGSLIVLLVARRFQQQQRGQR